MLPGILHELTGCADTMYFHGLPYPDRPHFTMFDYETGFAAHRRCRRCSPRRRNPSTRRRSAGPDQQHAVDGRRTSTSATARLVQPSFLSSNGKWWTDNWITETVDTAHRRIRRRRACRAQRRLLRCHPDSDHHRQLRSAHRTGTRDSGGARRRDPQKVVDMIRPIVEARREQPQTTSSACWCRPRLTDDDGVTHHLTDREIDSFVLLLLGAGSGTTWKQMGTTLTALLQRPDVLDAVRDDRQLLRPAIEESVRWMPTDPMFSRWVVAGHRTGWRRDTGGIGGAHQDRRRQPGPGSDGIAPTSSTSPGPCGRSLGFGQGTHICLGMHVARAEMTVAISAHCSTGCRTCGSIPTPTRPASSACTSAEQPRYPSSSTRR